MSKVDMTLSSCNALHGFPVVLGCSEFWGNLSETPFCHKHYLHLFKLQCLSKNGSAKDARNVFVFT